VVVGVGNVAVDVTRVLTAPLERLQATDMPQHVLEALSRSTINDVHVLGRRGPAQATWTTKELKELAELDGVDVVLEDVHDLELEPVSAALVESDRVVARNVEVIKSWAEHVLDGTHRHIHLHFHARPVEMRGTDRVSTVVVERTTVDEHGAHGTGETYEVGAQLVIRSVGYRGVGLEGVPFDDRRNVIPNVDGRVVDADGAPVPGLYVAGWIKRGPTGIIGTNKKDAAATVASLLEDLGDARGKGGDGVVPLLAERGVDVVTLDGWAAIDRAERALGSSHGRERTTIHERDALMAASRA
jgi:ferredoxin--NADP+ reductase